MKVKTSSKISIYRFAVLLLLLCFYVPLTLLTGASSAGSNFSRGALRGPAVYNSLTLKNCRVTSTAPTGDTSYLQKALSSLVMEISDTGIVTGQCQASFNDPKYPGVNIKSNFKAIGHVDLPASIMLGTYTLDIDMIGKGGTINSRLGGGFQSISPVSDTTQTLDVLFGVTKKEAYVPGSNGENVAEEGGITSFNATFDGVLHPIINNSPSSSTQPGQQPSATPSDQTKKPGSLLFATPKQRVDEFWNYIKKTWGDRCFIATAAYGSATAPQLDTLREFRDKVLMNNDAGRLFVVTYYHLSPPLADFIADKDALRWVVRVELLDPIVFILQNSQQIWNN